EKPPGLLEGRVRRGGPPRVAFLFSGCGPGRLEHAQQFAETLPEFRRAWERCTALLGGPPTDQRSAAFAWNWSLAQMWRSWGVEPPAVACPEDDHASACVAGVLRAEDAVSLLRGGPPAKVTFSPPQIRMLAGYDPESARASLRQHAFELFVE